MPDDKNLPKPAEPADAGTSETRKTPPIWPDDYDTSEQPNQPEKRLGRIASTSRPDTDGDKPKKSKK